VLSRRVEWALRHAASILVGNPTVCWFASFLQPFFFQTKKKVDRSPFQREKHQALSAKKEKVKENPPAPSAGKNKWNSLEK
jgi:hypothetical protein